MFIGLYKWLDLCFPLTIPFPRNRASETGDNFSLCVSGEIAGHSVEYRARYTCFFTLLETIWSPDTLLWNVLLFPTLNPFVIANVISFPQLIHGPLITRTRIDTCLFAANELRPIYALCIYFDWLFAYHTRFHDSHRSPSFTLLLKPPLKIMRFAKPLG